MARGTYVRKITTRIDVLRIVLRQVKQQQATHAEDRKAMLEIIQSKGEELLRREEEGKTMRLLYESEVGVLSCPVPPSHRLMGDRCRFWDVQ